MFQKLPLLHFPYVRHRPLLRQLLPPPDLQQFLRLEPAVLLVQHGIQWRSVVFLQPAEKDNSTVLHRRNVSQDEQPVKLLTLVSMIQSVHETSLVSVLIVSTDEQMTKTNVVSSDESKQCVVMIISPTTNQVHAVFPQRSGILPQIPVSSVAILRHHLSSRPEWMSHILPVLGMVTQQRHTSSIVSQNNESQKLHSSLRCTQ